VLLPGALLFGAPIGRAPAADRVPASLGVPSEPVARIDGQPYLSAQALARMLGATRFWRADVRKLVLRAGAHRVVLTVDNPFVVIDQRTIRLGLPVRTLQGELHVPVALGDSLPRDSTLARLVFEPRGQRVVVVPPGGVIGTPRIQQSDNVTRVTFECDRPGEARVVGRAHAHFRLRLDGFFAGYLPESLPADGLLRSIREIPAATGSGFELEIAPSARGWRLVRSEDRVTLEIAMRESPDHESFAPEEPPGPRALRVIVLDPGHGGAESGVQQGGLIEKELALRLAQALRGELERRLGVRVFSTRETDATLSEDQRAEAANRVHADLVLSLHFDGVPGSSARGITAYCPPATYGDRPGSAPGPAAPIEILPWRDVATRHAVRARDVAETLLATLELRGHGPTRLRETLPYPLLGVNAPGLMLECGTLTWPEDRARLQSPNGIADLAASIAEGVEGWEKER
jgi:N-acetylmuramoyl-L-alanine amidase